MRKRISELNMLSLEEEYMLKEQFNNTFADYPRDKCVHQLFEEQVLKTPDKTAVIACDKTLTYDELNKLSNKIANSLIEKGVKINDIVAFALPRNSYLIAVMFGVLKSGAAYMPIAVDYPQDRIDYMLRNVAVLFVDIRGFTPLSESMEPEQVVDILNGYLELTTASIFRHGGTLDKFIGDATMAVFNAPFDTDDYIYKAVLAAWDIVQGGNRIEKEYLARYGKHVGFGVGINCGPAVVGNIGCDFRMDYTAIGDTVNTAARLEANAPRGTVYISEYVYERVKNRIQVEEVGEIPLKGKSKGVFVYSIVDVNGYESPEAEEYRGMYEEAAF